MPRFVILRHDPEPGSSQRLHWDFMLEEGSSLLTWSLQDEPFPNCHISAEQLADHRLEYIDFEGPVSRARGRVSRWDAGTYEWRVRTLDELAINLHGQKLHGQVHLQRSSPDTRWVLSLSGDSAADAAP